MATNSSGLTNTDVKKINFVRTVDEKGNIARVVSPNDFQVGTRSAPANMHVSGVLTVGSGTIKITSNDVQFGKTATVMLSGNDLKFFDAYNMLGLTLSQLSGSSSSGSIGPAGPSGSIGPAGPSGSAGPSNLIIESSGPTSLSVMAITDGTIFMRSGTTVVGISGAISPASSTNFAIVIFSGTTGRYLQNSSLSISGTTLSGLTTILNAGNDFTLTQLAVSPFSSVASFASSSTLVLKSGRVGIRNSSPSFTIDISGDMRVAGSLSGPGISLTNSYVLGNLSAVNITPTRTGIDTGYFAGLSFEPQLNTDTATIVTDVWGITGNARMMGASNVTRAMGFRGTVQHTSTGISAGAFGFRCDGITKSTGFINNAYGFYCVSITAATSASYGFYAESGMSNYFGGPIGAGVITPQALLHLNSGSSSAKTAPLKFTSGPVMTSPEIGAFEFLTDDFFVTISTGVARKGFILDDGKRLKSGSIPIASTNGRLIDCALPLSGSKIYYVADTSLGAVTRKLTFTNGILTSET